MRAPRRPRSSPARRRRFACRWTARSLDLHFIVEALGEERPNRTVDQAGGQGFLGRRPAFTLDEAAGKLARGGRALAVIAGEREEIGSGPRRARGRGIQHNRVAILNETTTGRLLGEKTGFEAEGGVADLSFDANLFSNFLLPFRSEEPTRGCQSQ